MAYADDKMLEEVAAERDRLAADYERLVGDWNRLYLKLQKADPSYPGKVFADSMADALIARVQALEGAAKPLIAQLREDRIWEWSLPCDAAMHNLEAALAAQPDCRQDMGSRADNYKDQEPPHIRGA